jgi:hypothetical protein
MTLAPHCVLCSAGVRRSPAEKREIIDLVEHSALSIGRILAELAVPRSSFCRWYQQVDGREPSGSGEWLTARCGG